MAIEEDLAEAMIIETAINKAKITQIQARTIVALIKDGHFTRQSVVDAVTAGDLSKLVYDNPNTEPRKLVVR